MSFQPCPACRRHVASIDTVCPFCRTRTTIAPRSTPSLVGRVTRAAVFAGVAACAGRTHTPPPPPPPPVEYPFALPPPPAEGRASVSGVVREDGYRRAGVPVTLRNIESGAVEQQTTNDKGEYQFVEIEPGTYELVADPGYLNQRPQDGPVMQPVVGVELAANANERRDLSVVAPAPYTRDTGPCCKPYGAPPARRRVV